MLSLRRQGAHRMTAAHASGCSAVPLAAVRASRAAGSRREATAPFRPLERVRYCLLTTVEAAGGCNTARVGFALDGDRLLVAVPAQSEVPGRVWRSSMISVTPSNLMGGAIGSPIGVDGRVLPAADEPAAAKLLAYRAGRLERLRLRLQRRRGGELVYIELVPADYTA